ncbi:MAG TPA: response regulator [Phycisphaerae bacterium]|nr:response regulator [Phycisphaerae bacterium]HRY67615.1 response regulator [Phycisphaerae bacterium]HSA25002.1 response regulator [Phycisphaerae bacterium]
MKILHADDDATSRIALRHILKAEPTWQITEAQDGQVAWELLKGGFQPDLCLFDIKMPRLSGHQLVQRIRSDSRWRNLHVVMISSIRSREMILSLAALQISAYLLKPYVAAKVLDTLRRALRFNVTDSLTNPESAIQRLCLTPARYLEVLTKHLIVLDSRLAEVREAAQHHDRMKAAEQLDDMAVDCIRLGAERFGAFAIDAGKALRTPNTDPPDLHPLEEELMNLQAACERLKESFSRERRAVLGGSYR